MGTLDMVTASRRRHKRVNALGRCFVQLGGGWEGSVMNLSVGGMLLRLKRALTLGSTYFVKLFLEGGEVAIVEAKVLRLLDADESNGECKAALKFTSISLEDADSLRGFLLR